MASVKDIERAHVGISASIDRVCNYEFKKLVEEVQKLYPGMVVKASEQSSVELRKILIKHWVSVELDPLKVSPQRRAKVKAREVLRKAKKENFPSITTIAGMTEMPDED